MHKTRVLVSLMLVFTLMGCFVYRDELAGTVPAPPPELLDLPRRVKIQCYSDPNLNRGDVVVWELPGVEPLDPNSEFEGYGGKQMGSLSPCTVVTATSYAWSPTDQEFWVYLEAKEVEGWVILHLVDLAP